jgi:hypothetical protein
MPDQSKLRSRRCECGDAACVSEILISWEEQDRVDHDDRNLFVVAVGHESVGPESRQVVWGSDRFTVIEII